MPWAEPPPLKPQLLAWGLLQTFFGRFELCDEETFTWCFTRHNTQQNFYRPVAHQTLWTPVNCHYSQSNVAQFVNHWVVCGHCKLAHAPTSNVSLPTHPGANVYITGEHREVKLSEVGKCKAFWPKLVRCCLKWCHQMSTKVSVWSVCKSSKWLKRSFLPEQIYPKLYVWFHSKKKWKAQTSSVVFYFTPD